MNLRTQRATCHTLEEGWLYAVRYHGADYIVQKGNKGEWKIRHRGTDGVLHILYPSIGEGKEEAIAWIEKHC